MPVRLLLAQAWYFYPRPPRGGRPLLPSMAARARAISIHALREEGDFLTCRVYNMHKNFYPRPPRGGRQQFPLFWLILLLFLSTPSARRATTSATKNGTKYSNFYPRPPRGGRQACTGENRRTGRKFLSTPSARRATTGCDDTAAFRVISIHALREEGDDNAAAQHNQQGDFYPRPPRGGRRWSLACCRSGWYFYPRPPRGGRHHINNDNKPVISISIHALREEGDSFPPQMILTANLFLSTPSARRATIDGLLRFAAGGISIHALREEGDPAL